MLDDRYYEISQAYLLLCGAAYLLEGYNDRILPILRSMPDKSAYHILDGAMLAVLDARHLLEQAFVDEDEESS